MEYASNGKGNLGVTLGAIGTGLGVLNGGLGGILGGFGANPAAAAAMAAGDSDNHFVSRYEAGQSARIAELETEVKLRDANAYTDKKILEVYQYRTAECARSKSSFASSALSTRRPRRTCPACRTRSRLFPA